jgi:GntR family transcriptional regulator, transcriptional repressor for pyruvate dehydrogenase complex
MAILGPVSRPSVPDQVFARLCDLIVSEHYEPGERLPTQRALADEFGVNMASVREAIKRLEQLRLVEVRHGDATRVLDWRRAGLEALALLETVDMRIVRPLFEARRLVLSQVARLAAERRSDAQADAIESAAQAVVAADSDEAAQVADWAFVSAAVASSGNLVFELIANSVRELYLSHHERFVALVADRDELRPLYLAVAEAIRDRDRDAAESAMSDLTAAHEARMLKAG